MVNLDQPIFLAPSSKYPVGKTFFTDFPAVTLTYVKCKYFEIEGSTNES